MIPYLQNSENDLDNNRQQIADELAFWEKNVYTICIKRQVPEQLPPIKKVKQTIENFFAGDCSYYDIFKRINYLKNKYGRTKK